MPDQLVLIACTAGFIGAMHNFGEAVVERRPLWAVFWAFLMGANALGIGLNIGLAS